MSERSKLLSLLGLAKKAGRLSLGHDAVLDALKRKKALLILLAADASERVEKEMQRESRFYQSAAPLMRIPHTMEEIGNALPHRAGVISVNDTSFAQAMKKIIEEG